MGMYGLSKKELYERVGHMNQLAGTKRYVLKEGKKDQVNAVDMWNGSGVYLTIASDRTSDMTALTYKGQSLCWLSNLGISSPVYREQGDFAWNHNFSGGMFSTCGLNTAGLPDEDGGEHLELHGAVSNLPSEEICCRTYWEGDDYFLEYSGKTWQSQPFGENVCLTRTITMKMGENRIRIHDHVENLGFRDFPFMIVYHMNFGYPLLDEGSRLYLTYQDRFPTSEWAAASEDQIGVITKPDVTYKARAYNHTVRADENGYAYASLMNETIGLGATVKFDASVLDRFNLWKCLQKGDYVVGLEPCNCRTWGRSRERESGHLDVIRPFESRDLELELQIHDGSEEIRRAAARYPGSL